MEKSAARLSKSVGRISKMYEKPLVFIANSVHALCRVGAHFDKKQIKKTMSPLTKKDMFSIEKGTHKSSKRQRRKDNETLSEKVAKMEPELMQKVVPNQLKSDPKTIIEFVSIFDAKMDQNGPKLEPCWDHSGAFCSKNGATLIRPGVVLETTRRKDDLRPPKVPKCAPQGSQNDPQRLRKWFPKLKKTTLRLPKWSPHLYKMILEGPFGARRSEVGHRSSDVGSRT